MDAWSMTLAEAVLTVERTFTVHQEAGLLVPSYKGDEAIETGARDMDFAPNGERYVTVTSMGDPPTRFFADESAAIYEWQLCVMDLAEEITKDRDRWKALHLYWRDRPSVSRHDYVGLGQPALLQVGMGDILTLELVMVRSRLLISKVGPDGKESDA